MVRKSRRRRKRRGGLGGDAVSQHTDSGSSGDQVHSFGRDVEHGVTKTVHAPGKALDSVMRAPTRTGRAKQKMTKTTANAKDAAKKAASTMGNLFKKLKFWGGRRRTRRKRRKRRRRRTRRRRAGPRRRTKRLRRRTKHRRRRRRR
jgi:hypothetical protein